MYQDKNGCAISVANMSAHELLCFVSDFQALLWRVEIPLSRIELLNDFVIAGLDEDTPLFMKNASFRDTLLLAGERERVDEFFDKMKERQSASTVFRITNKAGNVMWLKLVGVRSSCDPNYYHGTLSDVTDTAAVVTEIAEKAFVHESRSVLPQAKPKTPPHFAGSQYEIDIEDSLQNMLKALQQREDLDGALFSVVHGNASKVIVYYSGKAFEGVAQGEIFPYKGTIAQDIEHYSHDHLIVDNTMDSIKPIDWALFVPRGIRSYYAKPYYLDGVMTSVVIVCSKKSANFKGKSVDAYDDIFDPFVELARTWRRQDNVKI